MTTILPLPLDDMDARHIGLTSNVAGTYLEAARVCFDRHYAPPQEFVLRDGTTENTARVEWHVTDERCRAAWANKDDSVRDGAYACALAATELVRGLYAIRRAETLTGSDYYIGPADQSMEDLENCFRLEVSGTDRGNNSEVLRRLKDKVKQARAGNSNLPALAAVVGFYARLIAIQTVD